MPDNEGLFFRAEVRCRTLRMFQKKVAHGP
jgi:hypothetical protein